MSKKLIKTFAKLLMIVLAVVGAFLLFMGSLHLMAPWYAFPSPKPFEGKLIYNPYQNMDSRQWHKANFHMHSHAWGGITNGKKNNDTTVWKVYSDLGFTSLSVSNYQYINKLYSDSMYYIPAYEHGYGIFKNHQLCLGASHVDWFDMPFRQTISQKQYMIDRLHRSTEIISINHPMFFGGYTPDDFTRLTSYDLIEALNGFRNSIVHWDSALSAGRPAMMLANDDMHDINNPREATRRFTMISTPSAERNNVIKALKAGCAFGVYAIIPDTETWQMKKARLDSLPVLQSVAMHGDTLRIEVNKPALEFRFYGQGGKLLAKSALTTQAWYVIKPSDTYVRSEILFSTRNDSEGLQYFLNPVLRSADGKMPPMPVAVTDKTRTLVNRILIIATALFIAANIIILRKRFKQYKP